MPVCAGTDGQRIYVLNCQRTDGQDGNIMVVDQHLRLRFCSAGISTLLGFPLRKLATMKLDQLLPTPYNTMHNKWIKVRLGRQTAGQGTDLAMACLALVRSSCAVAPV